MIRNFQNGGQLHKKADCKSQVRLHKRCGTLETKASHQALTLESRHDCHMSKIQLFCYVSSLFSPARKSQLRLQVTQANNSISEPVRNVQTSHKQTSFLSSYLNAVTGCQLKGSSTVKETRNKKTIITSQTKGLSFECDSECTLRP